MGMMRLNKKEEYGLMALRYLYNRPGNEPCTAKEISLALGVPFDVISKVLRTLALGEVIKVSQGVKGGYYPNKSLDEVSFYQLAKMISGPIGLVKCLIQENCDIKQTCNISSPVARLNEKLIEFYQSISIGALLASDPIKEEVIDESI